MRYPIGGPQTLLRERRFRPSTFATEGLPVRAQKPVPGKSLRVEQSCSYLRDAQLLGCASGLPVRQPNVSLRTGKVAGVVSCIEAPSYKPLDLCMGSSDGTASSAAS